MFKSTSYVPISYLSLQRLALRIECCVSIRWQKLSFPPDATPITCWSMFGPFPGSLCLHRLIERLWFHRVIWLPAERSDAPRPHCKATKRCVQSRPVGYSIQCHQATGVRSTEPYEMECCLTLACWLLGSVVLGSSVHIFRCNSKKTKPKDALFL